MKDSEVKKFREEVYLEGGRAGAARPAMPWRTKITPYRVLVSEIMLQQTQVVRVIDYFNNWMKLFPDFAALANASKSDVLNAWMGLGYNSRGLRLWELARVVVRDYAGKLPKTENELKALPGIGPYTASAITAFAYNLPTVMIETNIRRVYIHHFFADQDFVDDKELLPIIAETMDTENPRAWYQMLMDYGSVLPKIAKHNANKQSKHYTKQSRFEGSNRQMRAAVTGYLLAHGPVTGRALTKHFADDPRLPLALSGLLKDSVIVSRGGKYSI
jgi:A/G-specific adenine glycosylase